MQKKLTLSLILILVVAVSAGAKTIVVGFDPAADYQTIQQGINAAFHGDEVVVLDGIYTGPGNRNMDYVGRQITVRSANGPARCIIDLSANAQDPKRAFIFRWESMDTVLEGFTIRNGHIVDDVKFGYLGNAMGGAIFLEDSFTTIRNCVFVNNVAPYGGAIAAIGSSTGACKPNIINCTFANNTAVRGGSLYAGKCSDINLTNDILWGGSASEGAEIALYNIGWGATVSVLYSNVAGGREGVWGVGIASHLIWGDGNHDLDPLFVDPNRSGSGGSLVEGDFHLKSATRRWDAVEQQWEMDDEYSPCIDGGQPAMAWSRETWPNGLRMNMGAFGGTVQASCSPETLLDLEDANYPDQDRLRRDYLKLESDLNENHAVSLHDFAFFANSWQKEGNQLREDFDRNGHVDGLDLQTISRNWLPDPLVAGEPLPLRMTWAKEPNLVGESGTTMEAAVAFSTDGSGVEYFFEDYYSPEVNSGWLSFPTGQAPVWGEQDLNPGQWISYHVKARNKGNLVETDWAFLHSVEIPSQDKLAPLPNPSRWDIPPHWINSLTIAMEAVEAKDESGVEYYFECTTDPEYSSEWQDSNEYSVSVASRDSYGFRVFARDKSSNKNMTLPSAIVTPDSTAPTPDPMEFVEGGKPRMYLPIGGGTFDWRVTMTAVEANDEDGGAVEYYFGCVNDPRFDSGWITTKNYDRLVGQGSFTYRVKARDASGNETDWSDPAIATK